MTSVLSSQRTQTPLYNTHLPLLTHSFKGLPLSTLYNYISENTVFSIKACNDIIHTIPALAFSQVSDLPDVVVTPQEPSETANALQSPTLTFLEDPTGFWEGLQNSIFSCCSDF